MGKCKKCRKQRKYLSRAGYCDPCGNKIRDLVVAQLRAGQGQYYEKWKAGMLQAIEGKSTKKKATAKRK